MTARRLYFAGQTRSSMPSAPTSDSTIPAVAQLGDGRAVLRNDLRAALVSLEQPADSGLPAFRPGGMLMNSERSPCIMEFVHAH